MNRIFKFFNWREKREKSMKRGNDTENKTGHVSQLSPRITRSRSRNIGIGSTSNLTEDNKKETKPPKRTRNKIKTTSNPLEEVPKSPKFQLEIKQGTNNETRSDQFSPNTTLTCPQTPNFDLSDLEVLKSPRNFLNPPSLENDLIKSPTLETISANTPDRNAGFHREIENIADSRHRILGKGSFGKIIHATYKGELVAAKVVPASKSNSLKNELNNFLLSHPNIVQTLRIICSEEFPSYNLVIMEMCSSSNLEHLIDEETYILDDKTIRSFMLDVAQALDYCHGQKVLHLDVKPQNILVNTGSNICKLCDFGSSCLLPGEDSEPQDATTKCQGTVVYMAPEILKGKSPTEKSDVYSFGITLWQLVHRRKPYVMDIKIDLQSTTYKIVKEKLRPGKYQANKRKAGKFEIMYTSCWSHEPNKRPSIKDVIKSLESSST